MSMVLKWRVDRDQQGAPVEYRAELPSGGEAVITLEDEYHCVALVKSSGNPDESGTFASVLDAQTAIEADEVQRLVTRAVATGAEGTSTAPRSPAWLDVQRARSEER